MLLFTLVKMLVNVGAVNWGERPVCRDEVCDSELRREHRDGDTATKR